MIYKKKKFPKWEDVILLLAIIGFFTLVVVMI